LAAQQSGGTIGIRFATGEAPVKPDLSPVVRGEKKVGEVVASWSVDDLR